MAVIKKKDEKAKHILSLMSDTHNEVEFKTLFKTNYPEDYALISKTYNKEERNDTKGKGHPIPMPDKYLHNMYNVAIKKMKEAED